MKQSRIENILLCLSAGQIDTGWATFLDTYSKTILHIARQFATDDSAVDDCFEYVCAKLSDNSFSRLKAFDPSGPARFKTWLTAVTANLCKDWRRSLYGRKRLPESVRRLPEFDQLVFECFYRRGMTHQECLYVLKSRFTKLTLDQISDANARLHSVLSSKQRWQLSVARDDSRLMDDSAAGIESEDDGPEYRVQSDEDRLRIKKALARLEPQQRLLLQLRYQQDLTLREVAQLTGQADAFKARRQIEAALAALRKAMKI